MRSFFNILKKDLRLKLKGGSIISLILWPSSLRRETHINAEVIIKKWKSKSLKLTQFSHQHHQNTIHEYTKN